MSLTPQMIDAFNKASGNNVPLDAKPGVKPVQSRADEIRALGKAAQPQAQPNLHGTGSIKQNEGGASFDTLKSNIAKVPGQAFDLAKTAADKLTGGVAKDVKDTIGANAEASSRLKLADQDSKYVSTILHMRKEAQAKGEDTSHWDDLVRNYRPMNDKSQSLEEMFPTLKKSNEQVIGDFAQMAANIISAGSIESGAKTALSPAKGFVKGALRGAKAGALQGGAVGASQGLAEGLKEDESAGGVIKSTLKGGAEGAVVGGALGGVVGGLTAEPLTKPSETINKHFRDAEHVYSDPDFPAKDRAQMGEYMKATQKDIVDGLKAEGHLTEATEISNLDTSKFKNFDDFEKATQSSITSEKATGSMTNKVRAYFAKDNVDPRLEASAKRLEKPEVAYRDYSKQAQNALKDVKADPPIAKVGENIGDAYDSVVKTRRAVGQKMADELVKVKDVPVDITEPSIKFVNGIEEGAGKMTSFDKSLVDNYTAELKALYSGQHPTASQVDDFLSRVPNELDVAKAAKNVTNTTNAERIIKGNLAEIRKALTTQPGMQEYSAARNAYSQLSDFLDEGSRYLGSKTGGGDFARDVSVAKSAAESILSGGKKDWLVELENLTGYKALDDATLAIQAMKDVGDKRGLSLFKSMGESAMSPTSLPFRMLQWGTQKAAKGVMGTPAEQTAAFLKSLGK